MKDKVKKRPSFKPARIRDNQRGALLLGLIITMVILSVLGGSMVYIFSSSTLNPISGNYAQQAYYNAEAGFRYVTALYRKTGDKTVLNPYLSETPITLPNGGQAKVTLTAPTNSVPATFDGATGLTFSTPPAIADLKAPGFFSTSAAPTVVYRYRGITPITTSVTITGATLTGITPSVPASGAITIKPTTYITSKGSFGSGFWNVSRTVNYAWALSGGPTGFSGDSSSTDTFSSGLSKWGDGANPMGTFTIESGALKVTGVNAGLEEALRGYTGTTTNDLSSYEVQVKICLYPANEVVADTYVNGLTQYMAGITFRKQGGTSPSATDQSYGVSFIRGINSGQTKGTYIPNDLIPTDSKAYIVLWRDDGNPASEKVTLLAYNLIETSSIIKQGMLRPWTTLLVRVEELKDASNNKYNQIKVMYGHNDAAGIEYDKIIGDALPMNDNYRKTSSRGGVTFSGGTTGFPWPTNNFTSDYIQSDDYFTLIEWDSVPATSAVTNLPQQTVNTSVDTDLTTVLTTALKNVNISTIPGASLLYTLGSSEVGLHAWGTNMANKTFFDDFAIRIKSTAGGGYVPPIQY